MKDALQAYFDEWELVLPQDAREALRALLSKLRAPVADERKNYCPEKRKPGGCQLHNLHCGYPKCNEAPAADTQEVPQDTGNPKADLLIGRLMSSDPDFEDCAEAARLIRSLASAPVAGERAASDIDWQLLRDTVVLVRNRFSAALGIAYANSDATRAAIRRANETHGALMAMLDAALSAQAGAQKGGDDAESDRELLGLGIQPVQRTRIAIYWAVRDQALDDAEEAVVTLYESDDPVYLPDITLAIRALKSQKK